MQAGPHEPDPQELQAGPHEPNPQQAARDAGRKAAAEVRVEMLNRGRSEALGRADTAKAEKYRKALDNLPQTGKGMTVDKVTGKK